MKKKTLILDIIRLILNIATLILLVILIKNNNDEENEEEDEIEREN